MTIDGYLEIEKYATIFLKNRDRQKYWHKHVEGKCQALVFHIAIFPSPFARRPSSPPDDKWCGDMIVHRNSRWHLLSLPFPQFPSPSLATPPCCASSMWECCRPRGPSLWWNSRRAWDRRESEMQSQVAVARSARELASLCDSLLCWCTAIEGRGKRGKNQSLIKSVFLSVFVLFSFQSQCLSIFSLSVYFFIFYVFLCIFVVHCLLRLYENCSIYLKTWNWSYVELKLV